MRTQKYLAVYKKPKGTKALPGIRVKCSFLLIRNQRKRMSRNDNTRPLENENYRLEYQLNNKTETPENSVVNEMGEASVPVGDHWKYCYESCKAVAQRLEEIHVQRTRDGLIKTLKSLENSVTCC